MLRIIIADDHPIVRQGLKQIVAETSDMVVAGEASNGKEVLNKVGENDYDVVLLDISMPGESGMDILGELKKLKPGLPVLVLSIHPEEQYAVRMLRAGASGYLTKDKAPRELIEAIRKVSLGRKYVSSSLAERFALHLEIGTEKPLHETLSNREYQVMCMIALGKMVRDIAQELSLSVKTISTYRLRVLKKMKMESSAELIRYAIQNQLVD